MIKEFYMKHKKLVWFGGVVLALVAYNTFFGGM